MLSLEVVGWLLMIFCSIRITIGGLITLYTIIAGIDESKILCTIELMIAILSWWTVYYLSPFTINIG